MSRARELAKAGGLQQRIVGVSSFVGVSTFAQDVSFYQNITVSGDLNVTGDLSYDSTTASSQKITGISTLNQTETNDIIVSAGATVTGALDVDGGADIASGLTVTGGLTANSAQISDLTAGRVVIAGTSGELEDDAALSFSGGTLSATTFSGSGALLNSIPNAALDNSSITITAGDGLSGTATPSLGGSASLSVNVDDSSIEISSDTLQVKASGVTNAMLAGSIANSKLSNSTVSYGGVTLSLGGSDATPAFNLADATGLPVSTGIDGLGANVATFLATPSSSNLRSAVTGETGSGALVFGTSPTIASPTITGGTFTGRQEINDASFSGGVTVGAGLTVTGNLVVNGTTTTINSTTISVDDKHIELGATASPTDSSADGGGVILKGSSDHSILWYNDNDHWQSSEHFNLVSGKSYQIADTAVLSATALGSGVVSSSLTSVGTITSGVWQGTAIANAYLANSTISGTSLGSNLPTATFATSGTGLSGSATYNGTGAATFTVTSNATSSNTGSTIVARNASGNFSAGTITATLSGTATNATNFNVAADNSTNATHYITFTGGATGNQRPNSDTALTYNPSSNTLSAGTFSGTLATSNLSGTVSNAQLANSSVSFGGVSVSLGGSDSTPAFNLADATGYRTSALTGLASNMATFLATPTSANLRATVTNETGSGSLVFGTNPTLAGATLSNHLVPNANGTINLGASATRFANVFSSDLDLSNEAKGPNSIDGTWGSYLIEEGEEHLYITNRRSGRRYRFMMEEV